MFTFHLLARLMTFPSRSSLCMLLTFITLTPSTLFAQVVPGELTIHYDEPTWIFNANSFLLESREPRLDPNESELGDQLRPLLNESNYSGAIEVLESSERNGRELSPALNHILGQVYMAEQNNEKAVTAFNKAISVMPDFARAHQRLGLIHLQNKDYGLARRHLSKTIELGISDAETFGQLAFANLQDFSPWSAIQGYQEALLLQPENTQWQQGLLFALVHANDFKAAQSLIDEMLSQDTENHSLWLQSSNIALNNNDPISALSRLEIALLLSENDSANQVVAGQLHLQHGSMERAVELLEQGIASGGQDLYEPISEAITWFIYQQRWAEANRLIEAGLEFWTKLPSTRESRLLTHRAAIAQSRGETQEALPLLNQAIDLDPANGEALIALADIESKSQRLIQAALHYTRAAALSDFAERAFLGHAQLALDQQDYPQALGLLRQAYQVNPLRDDINQNIRTLERLVLNEQ